VGLKRDYGRIFFYAFEMFKEQWKIYIAPAQCQMLILIATVIMEMNLA
jgi:hypothetical protein